MKYLAMIQARCGSTRLPNKVLKDLCGKPALQRMIERVKLSKRVDEVMVVTSIEKNNLPILSLCSSIGIRVGIGSEDDVLDRFYYPYEGKTIMVAINSFLPLQKYLDFQ